MIYAIDFDGTLCEDAFPEAGAPKVEVIDYVKRLKAEGHTLILWTCRSGERLTTALEFCRKHGLEFDFVNESATENIVKHGNDCRKVYADYYIDDKAVSVESLLHKCKCKESGCAFSREAGEF